MNNNGFGFSFGFNPDDDDNGDLPNDIGKILGQFGSMLSDIGNTFASPAEGQEYVNYRLAEKAALRALQSTKGDTSVSESDHAAVTDAVRLVELWLDDATDLPASLNTVVTWNAADWVKQTLPAWKRTVEPFAKHMHFAQLGETIDGGHPVPPDDMMGMINLINASNNASHLAKSLATTAHEVLSGADFGLNVAPAGVTAILPANIHNLSEEIGVSEQDFLVYLAAREAARQRLYKNIPWLGELIVASAEEYSVGLKVDISHIEQAMDGLSEFAGDPAAMKQAMDDMLELNLHPKVSTLNTNAEQRLETLMALIEGWVEFVVDEAMGPRVPATATLARAWARRRETGGSAKQLFSEVIGIKLQEPRVEAARELWSRITQAVGVQRRDQIWSHPDFIPQAAHLDNPADFIDSLLDEASIRDFDPIAEIAALEEELAKKAAEAESASADSASDPDADPQDATDASSSEDDSQPNT
ncbi:zinc-dependent metalloprotease [Corynebacterium sp. HS2168-gen11]|uniref:zinc-dependent metalloprotease n=1 Tax=Corynebacterium sp. HS2168-gen11 TaxID=2974027 RepID=UPI00216B1B1B|nr:zinc-dependent metalloprotease [Corynebacterium sp. HS2168-gen11]MCS4535815.1 zinc-dependent metalloprotease [Corynebacterium sp. HS2168-gen11]